MTSIKQLSFIALAIIFVMNSCTIEKRIYSSGYHIDWKNGNRKSNKQELVKDNMGKQSKQNKIANPGSCKRLCLFEAETGGPGALGALEKKCFLRISLRS